MSALPDEAERRKVEVKRVRLAEGERGEEGRRKGARWCGSGERGRNEMSLVRRRLDEEGVGSAGPVGAAARLGLGRGEGD